MKNLLYLIPLAALFACNSTSTEETEINITEETPVNVDTTAILLGQEVMFENLVDGQEISSPFTVKMGVAGMTVEPANNGINANKGHHHLLIDTMSFISSSALIPMVDKRIIHFGGGQTEYELVLSPGTHKIAMQFANGMHASYGPRMAKAVTVTVK
jgi:hypothetical protein